MIIAAQHNIVGDVHGGNESHAQTVFRDKAHGNAVFDNFHWGGAGQILAFAVFPFRIVIHDTAFLQRIQTGQSLAQFFLSGAGNACHTENFAREQVEIDVTQGGGAISSQTVEVANLHAQIFVLALWAVDGQRNRVLALRASIKLVVQIVAALIPVLYGGLRIETLSNFNFFSAEPYSYLGILSIPITVIWIVGLTNAVNFIDGLDGLAAGVSSISAITMLVISCILGDPVVAVVIAALAGAIIGFLPYNFNPAKIFMGDTGSNFLGFILATLSIQGLFKFYAVVSFAVPFLILGLPLFDMLSSIIRRVAKGQSPMAPDRGHIHHRLIDMGLSQKQAVAVLYGITCILGITGVVLASSGAGKAVLLLLAVILVCAIGFHILGRGSKRNQDSLTAESGDVGKNQPVQEEKTSSGTEKTAEDDQKAN